jgi:hypothetical protein
MSEAPNRKPDEVLVYFDKTAWGEPFAPRWPGPMVQLVAVQVWNDERLYAEHREWVLLRGFEKRAQQWEALAAGKAQSRIDDLASGGTEEKDEA